MIGPSHPLILVLMHAFIATHTCAGEDLSVRSARGHFLWPLLHSLSIQLSHLPFHSLQYFIQ